MTGFTRPVIFPLMFGHREYTFDEYLELDDYSNTKLEFFDGQIYAMAGGTPSHSALIASVTTHIGQQIRGGRCRVHSTELRIRVTATGLATYPDVVVVCGAWERDPADAGRNTVVNPIMLVEVLSPSTETYDRGKKLGNYKRIPSLRACLLLAHDRREIEIWYRDDPGVPWGRALAGPGGGVDLAAIGARLDVDAVYDDATEPSAAPS
jgi:Uma2 family endonuclease